MAVESIILLEIRLTDNTDPNAPSINPVRFTNAPFDVIDNNDQNITYLAAGDLLGIGDFENTYELITDGLEISLSGVNPAYQSIINLNGFNDAPIDIWLAQISPDTNQIINKVFYHRGFAGTPVTEHNETDGTIIISMQTRSAFKSLGRASLLMTTSVAHHQALTADNTGTYSSDLFYQYSADVGLGDEIWKN